ncbi:MAG: lysine 5,6-aminomutase subunit alpha [Anaerolineaceae bacterium]|nr:lysine 5,6-aminomutase subunit alpha [Anaerolineaceae bacterium]
MIKSKLNLDFTLVEQARKTAFQIADDVQTYIIQNTTVSVERTIARLLGVDGVDESGVPLPNILVNQLSEKNGLSMGAAFYIGNAMLALQKSPMEIAALISKGDLDITALPLHKLNEIKKTVMDKGQEGIQKILNRRKARESFISQVGDKKGPLLYVIVATGNIYEDIVQARAAAQQGADVVAVIRTTGQSLLDYVPYGATVEGFGGTYATQENFRLMRQALDEEGEKIGRFIRLCNYCSGLCMPEIAAMGALEGLDMMLNDALYGILFRDINMKRTLIDQYFSRMINGFAGIIINTGEDNYLTTADAFEEADTVLASQFINEQLAKIAGIPEEQMGLGHAFEINPEMENGFLYELAQAQMAREIFPNAPLKYMPPTKFMTGNIFRGHVQDALFNMVSVMTGQRILLLGMLTEAIHTPFMSDRYLSLENARYINTTLKDLGDEISFSKGGIIETRAHEVLSNAADLLARMNEDGLFASLAKGVFAGIKRSEDGGKGLEGVIEKDVDYFNPFIELFAGREVK